MTEGAPVAPDLGASEGTQADSDAGSPPLAVVSRVFPATSSSMPEIREFVGRHLAAAPVEPEAGADLRHVVSQSLLDGLGGDGTVQISFRIFPDQVEVEVVRSSNPTARPPVADDESDFAAWITSRLRREHLTQEAAARQLGVSVKTVNRWVRGISKPRLRHVRLLKELFGEAPPA